MKNKKILLIEDVKTNVSSFPEKIEKGTIGEEILIIDKEKNVIMVEFIIDEKVYLLTINKSITQCID